MLLDKNVVEATSWSHVFFCFNLCFVFVDRVRIFMFSLNKRLIINTFFLCFSIRIILFINFLMNNALMFVFSFSFLILYINVLFFLSSFNYFCWFKLMNFASSIVVAFSSCLLFVFVVATYDSIAVVVLLIFVQCFWIFCLFLETLHSSSFSQSTSTATRRRDAITTVVSFTRSCSQFFRAIKFVFFSLFKLFDWIEINLRKHSVFSRRRRDVCLAKT
jgi:hypothetical protein